MAKCSWDNSRLDQKLFLALASLLRLLPDQVQIETEESKVEDIGDADTGSPVTFAGSSEDELKGRFLDRLARVFSPVPALHTSTRNIQNSWTTCYNISSLDVSTNGADNCGRQ